MALLSSTSTRLCSLTSLPKPTFSPFIFLPPSTTTLARRPYATSKNPNKPTKKRKARTEYKEPPLDDMPQFNLLDAMRYIRAFEVGQPPQVPKYDLAIRLRSLKNGPVVRNRVRLPHPVQGSLKIAVIADPESKAGKEASKAGAVRVGEDDLLEHIKDGRIEFERLICHQDSAAKLNKYQVGRVLGPKGMMPSTKMGTIVKDVAAAVKGMVGATEYREKIGVVRGAVGQLGFTPQEMERNIRQFVGSVKKDIAALSELQGGKGKDVHEVVLSSTHSPGFTLNGEYSGPNSVPAQLLAVL